MVERRRERLGVVLGYQFKRPELLAEALTHPSIATPVHSRRANYDRLEFLGDRVLGVIVAEDLLARFPDAPAGELSRRFNALVRREALVRVAREIDLGAYLHMAKGERDAGGGEKPGILADACEAVIGALYLDGGGDCAGAFVRRYWRAMMDELVQAPKDAKTRLQEWAQGRNRALPAYHTVACEGPPHEPRFTIEATVEGARPARGTGSSKRGAEHKAAAALLEALATAGELDDD